MSDPALEVLRELLGQLSHHIRETVLAARQTTAAETFHQVAAISAADTIYEVDKISEEAILDWFAAYWPAEKPVQVVMEGVPDENALTFPEGTAVENTHWKIIIDPIDGTRSIMYDKRSAWILAGAAPQRGADTKLRDIQVAVMTELPTSKGRFCDQISAVREGGRAGLRSKRLDLADCGGLMESLMLQPSRASDCRHGFAALVRFLPEAKALSARIEEELWRRLYGKGPHDIFDDQYISTGGQIYELLAGHDRMLGDLRPLFLKHLGLDDALACHPYDICTALCLTEAGGIVTDLWGEPLSAPLDTVTPVVWVGYANQTLFDHISPVLRDVIMDEGLI